MNMIQSIMRAGLIFAMAGGLCGTSGAQEGPSRVFYREGQLWVAQGANIAPLTNSLELPFQITVNTNGTFQVGSHPPRPFDEGEALGADGMLLDPNGKLEPVMDHFALTAGKTVLSVNDDKDAVMQDIHLGPDKLLTTDRALVGRDGSWMRVIDGLLFTPDGQTIPAVDTTTLQNGQVSVQKEGTQFPIGPDRSIMMNEGTKVFGDGRVVSKDGTTVELTEGQIITLEGVVKLR